LLALALLIAVSGAVVMTALAGARRTHATPNQFKSYDGAPDAIVAFNNFDSFDGVDVVRRQPGVKRIGVGVQMTVLPYQPGNPNYLPLLAPSDDQFATHLFRGLLLRGHRLDQNAKDEILLSESDARILHAKVGDSIPLLAFTADQADKCLRSDEPPPGCRPLGETPKLRVRVVGIVRTDIDVTQRSQDIGFSILSRGFYNEHKADVGWVPFVIVQLHKRVSPEAFATGVRGDLGTTEAEIQAASGSAALDAVNVLSTGLMLFALVAAIAAAFAIGQAVVRQVGASADERTTLAALGVTRAGRVTDAVLPIALASLLGAVLAVVGAYLGSTFMPIGFARRIEPFRGFDFDALVLLVSAVAVVLFSAGVAAFAAVVSARRREGAHAVAGYVGARAAEIPLSPPATVGLRHAFGGPRDAVPARSAATGIAAAVAGVLAVITFSASLHHLTHSPRLYGWGWDVMDIADTAKYKSALLADRDLDAVAFVHRRAQVRVGDHPTLAMSVKPLDGAISAGIVRGRAPVAPNEVALGADTLTATHQHIGGKVDIVGTGTPLRDAKIVGVAAYATAEDGDPIADGAVLTPDALDHVMGSAAQAGDSGGQHNFAVSFRPGVDRAAALQRLEALVPSTDVGHAAFTLPTPPAEVDKLRQVESLPKVLAGFLVALGLLAIIHALVIAVRRRARDFAVLRTLGFRPRDVRASVTYEAGTLGLIGAIVGVPLGVLLGRAVWSRVADSLGLRAVDRVPLAALVLVMPLVVAVAAIVAFIPGRRAARQHPSSALRTE
jgi:hypothetical protein